MAGKMRVSALAEELGIPSKELLARLTQLGEYVKSPSSTIEAPLVRRLCDIYGVPAPRQPAPRSEVPEDPQAAEKRKQELRARLRQVSAAFLLDHPGTRSSRYQPITTKAIEAARFFGVGPASIQARRDTGRRPRSEPPGTLVDERFLGRPDKPSSSYRSRVDRHGSSCG